MYSGTADLGHGARSAFPLQPAAGCPPAAGAREWHRELHHGRVRAHEPVQGHPHRLRRGERGKRLQSLVKLAGTVTAALGFWLDTFGCQNLVGPVYLRLF